MPISKTTFIRLCFWILSQARRDAVKVMPEIMLIYLDEARMSQRTKEELLILIDRLYTGEITPKTFARLLFLQYPHPIKKGRILSLKEFKRVTSGIK